MKKKQSVKVLIGIACVVVLILSIVMVVLLNGRSSKADDSQTVGSAQAGSTQDTAQNAGDSTGTSDGQTTPSGDQTPPVNNPGGSNSDNNDSENSTPGGDNAGSNDSGNNDSGSSTPGGDNSGSNDSGNNDSGSSAPGGDNSGSNDSTETDPPQNDNETDDPSNGQETPPAGDNPPEKEPEVEEPVVISFPYQIPESGLLIEKMAPYSGMYVEDGTNANVQNVAMLLVKNNGQSPIEHAQIQVVCGQETLQFDVSALPAGEKLVVQEKTGKSIPAGDTRSATALVVQRANMEMSSSQVRVTDNGNNTLTIQNLTNETIPTVRVFYKYYMENEDVFVGGIAFTARIVRLGAGSSITIQPSHYTSQTSRVVMVLTYDSEV